MPSAGSRFTPSYAVGCDDRAQAMSRLRAGLGSAIARVWPLSHRARRSAAYLADQLGLGRAAAISCSSPRTRQARATWSPRRARSTTRRWGRKTRVDSAAPGGLARPRVALALSCAKAGASSSSTTSARATSCCVTSHIERVPLPAQPCARAAHNPALAIAEPAEHQTGRTASRASCSITRAASRTSELSPLLYVRDEARDEKTVRRARGRGREGPPARRRRQLRAHQRHAALSGQQGLRAQRPALRVHRRRRRARRRASSTSSRARSSRRASYGDASETSALSKLHVARRRVPRLQARRVSAARRVPRGRVRRARARRLGVDAREPRAPRRDAALREGDPRRRAGRRRGARRGHRGEGHDARARGARDQERRSRRSSAPRSSSSARPRPTSSRAARRKRGSLSDATARTLRIAARVHGPSRDARPLAARRGDAARPRRRRGPLRDGSRGHSRRASRPKKRGARMVLQSETTCTPSPPTKSPPRRSASTSCAARCRASTSARRARST